MKDYPITEQQAQEMFEAHSSYIYGIALPNIWMGAVLEDDIGTLYMNQGGDGGTADYYYFNFSPLTELNPKPEYVTLIVSETLHVEELEQGKEHKSLTGSFPVTL
ncbi:hypothetical protein [Paenibacillus borealis]|uniref:Uncharacterized protein n=1 Tax=Paenibacillus borealis TaxID=160799 RepID=A0A089MR47_PAEBO|nr:hypothetical protein [Paenibacillus borealis]AIQ58934.1 hypothetical protein PBOR_19895 [Paenibacillus borealis]